MSAPLSVDSRRNRGIAQGAASAVAAVTTSTVIVAPAEHPRLTVTLVVIGLLGLAVGLVVGSARVVAFAGAPILGAAVLHVQVADQVVALWALGVGCGWYLTSELAWESITRRIECRFTPLTVRQRTQEILAVLAIACLVATGALVVSNAAPQRTVLLEALVIVAVLAGGAYAIRRLTRGSPSVSE